MGRRPPRNRSAMFKASDRKSPLLGRAASMFGAASTSPPTVDTKEPRAETGLAGALAATLSRAHPPVPPRRSPFTRKGSPKAGVTSGCRSPAPGAAR